jgi:hypothetical protein
VVLGVLEVFLLSCPRAWQLYRIESLHPLRHPMKSAVLRDVILYDSNKLMRKKLCHVAKL